MTHADTTQTQPAAPQLVLERTFHATPERLWRYWTDPKLYAKWIYPGKTDVAMHEFEARVGGSVRFDMLLDTGEDMPNDGVFHVLDKPRRLEAGSPDRSFLLVATFEPVGSDRTLLRVTVTGLPPEYQEMARQGWNACFDKLERQVDAPGFSGSARGTAKGQHVEVTRWFKAPPEKVYGAWLDPQMLPRFFWPVGTGKVEKLDARPGGVLQMGHAEHPDWKATWRIQALEPGRSITIVDVWPDGSGHEATGTMEFTPENGGTRMKVRFGPFPATGPFRPEDAASGSAMVADRLAEEVETPAEGEGFRLVRHFQASPQRVFDMWTTPELLAKWWGESAKDMGFTFRVARLEPREGGAYDIVMANEQYGELHNHGVYTEFVPGKRLAYRWDFDIFLAPGEKPYPIMVRIDLEEVPTMTGATGTRMTFTQGPMAKAEHTEGSRQGVRANLAKLERALA
ncbi:MAG TPA: SRPBCC domain-containing protein [Candidatus Thermoplasmatota archaeon]|nr:SRPBCC domain-containing protein [Candidatus Thermoplasmatota archaeon]